MTDLLSGLVRNIIPTTKHLVLIPAVLCQLLAGATAHGAVTRVERPWRIAVSIPAPCLCTQGSVGYSVSEDLQVGANYYSGRGFALSLQDAQQYGAFARYKILGSSFFIQARLGHMELTEHDIIIFGTETKEDITDSGPSWGADFGNEWDFTDHIFGRIIWIGKDDFIETRKTSEFPHILRVAVGASF